MFVSVISPNSQKRCTDFLEMKKPPENSSCQKGGEEQVSQYQSKFNRCNDIGPRICAPQFNDDIQCNGFLVVFLSEQPNFESMICVISISGHLHACSVLVQEIQSNKKKCITVSSVVMVPKLYWEGYRIKMDLA